MVLKLLLTLIFSASCMFCGGSEDLSLQVKCQSSRYPLSTECSWTQSPAPNATTPIEFIASFRVGPEDYAETKLCIQPTPSTPSCTMYGFVLLSWEPHIFNVTAIHTGGISTTLLPFVPEEIIRPDPPVIVSVIALPGNQVQVQWNPPPTWTVPNVFSLKYHIRYKPCKSKYFRQVGVILVTTYPIKSVKPHTSYCIQVKAQDLYGYGEWSDWSPPVTFPFTPDN